VAEERTTSVAMTLGRRIAVLVVTVLMALMMAMPTAFANHNEKGFGQHRGGGDTAHSDQGNHFAKGGGTANNPHNSCGASCE
jgi:hypothetical protein